MWVYYTTILVEKMIGDLPLREKRKARKAIESFVAETTEKYGV
jgi:type I restriction enzyme R subunit